MLLEQNARIALKYAHRGYVLETGKVMLEGNAKDLALNEEVKKAYLGVKFLPTGGSGQAMILSFEVFPLSKTA